MTTTQNATAIPAARFVRIVNALATQYLAGMVVGAEWPFMVAYDAEVIAWVPRAGHVTLQLGAVDGPRTRTVTVCPGESRAFDVIAGDALVIGETRGVDAAFSLALDYLTAPLNAYMQNEHDPHAV